MPLPCGCYYVCFGLVKFGSALIRAFLLPYSYYIGYRSKKLTPFLKKFFPSDSALIDTLVRKDIDLMLMRILRSEIIGLQADGEKLVRKARDIVSKFGFLPPVAFFYDYNGAELYESMLDTIYRILKKHGKPQGLSELWHRFSAPLIASF